MFTRLKIRNFKRLRSAEIDLAEAVVFVGANNSGKTSALQALALWDIGWRRWMEKRRESSAKERTGVTINRRDLTSIPVPSTRLLWRDLQTHQSTVSDGRAKTDKVFITIEVEGTHADQPWSCGLEFYFANEESIYCRPTSEHDDPVPLGAQRHSIVYLPPMSGLADREYRKEAGEVRDLIGQGQTAQVLRNLCWQLFSRDDKRLWERLKQNILALFRVELSDPVYIPERSLLTLEYREASGTLLDISSSGRGCQQVLLLLSYTLANPGAVLLLDEPDAHLEILRQRDIYALLTETAASQNSQIIAASHSEVVLQEAGERDVVVAFVGKPHRIDIRSRPQVRKALESIRLDQYYAAEQKGWMLYLEGSTDLAILRRLSERISHPAARLLSDTVSVVYLGNNRPQEARDNFYGLREAKPDLVGVAIFDRLDKQLKTNDPLSELMWSRREIENYLVTPESLLTWAVTGLRVDDLIENAERRHRVEVMRDCIAELENALRIAGVPSPWGPDIKVTDQFLDPLFRNFYGKLGTPQRTWKRDYHELASTIPLEQLDPEITRALDSIVLVAGKASLPSDEL
jgi:hypothetical protein